MSITDEDVARMPGTRRALRHSLQTTSPYGSSSPYAPISSQETLRRPVMTPSLKTKVDNQPDHGPITPQHSWPLPRRLKRSDATPLIRMQKSSWTSNTERVKNDTKASTGIADMKANIKTQCKDHTGLMAGGIKTNDQSPGRDPSPSADLKPKPFFSGQQRSISHGMISKFSDKSRQTAELYIVDSEETRQKDRATHPRSLSVCSQQSGLAPTQPIPPLPFEIASKRFHSVKSPTDSSGKRGSGISLFSDNTSVLGDDWSKALSQADTDLTSLGLASPLVADSTTKCLGMYEKAGSAERDSSNFQERASPLEAAKALNFRPPLHSQRSFRASIQESLTRSNSSGLSMSLLEQGLSCNDSSPSLKDAAGTQTKLKLLMPKSGEKRQTRLRISQSSPLSHGSVFNIHEDVQSKRASTSILQTISGNEGSPEPNPMNKRPSSIATEDPFQWDAITFLQLESPSAIKGPEKKHKRQNCVRISNIPVKLHSPTPSAIEEGEENHHEISFSNHPLGRPLANRKQKQTTFRPPSRLNFDPQLTPTPHSRNDPMSNRSPYSPTLSMFNFYDEGDSPGSMVSTPTRKPPCRRPSGAHPNRQKSIFGNINVTPWPLPDSTNQETTDPEKPNVFEQNPEPESQKNSLDSRPSSFLFDFPSPPQRLNVQNWRLPKTPIRGPRAPPSSFCSPSRRRSPTRGVTKSYSTSPGKDLMRSVMALRRMNSEANGGDGGAKGHKRY